MGVVFVVENIVLDVVEIVFIFYFYFVIFWFGLDRFYFEF